MARYNGLEVCSLETRTKLAMMQKEKIIESDWEMICLGLKLNCFDSQKHEGRALVVMERMLMLCRFPRQMEILLLRLA